MIICFRCRQLKEERDFYLMKRKGILKRRVSCKQCTLSSNRAWRETHKVKRFKEPYNRELVKKYRRSYIGRMSRMYQQMHTRLKNNKSYLGKECNINDIAKFREFCCSSSNYAIIFEEWVASGYAFRRTPSLDRINPAIGYVWDNIQILALEDNWNRKGKGHDKLS